MSLMRSGELAEYFSLHHTIEELAEKILSFYKEAQLKIFGKLDQDVQHCWFHHVDVEDEVIVYKGSYGEWPTRFVLSTELLTNPEWKTIIEIDLRAKLEEQQRKDEKMRQYWEEDERKRAIELLKKYPDLAKGQ